MSRAARAPASREGSSREGSSREGSRPKTASAKRPLVLELDVADGALAPSVVAAGARLGIDVRLRDGAPRLVIGPDETIAHLLRGEVLASIDGPFDLADTATDRVRAALAGLVGKASSKSATLLREEADGRVLLVLRDRLPIDLGEAPEARAALRSARLRRVRVASEVELPAGAEERARAITFGPSRTLSDPSSRRVLEAFGIHAAPWRLAENAARAAAHARVLGYPVDLRVASPDVSAIDDARFGALELRTPGEVREAFRTVSREVRRIAPAARTLGVTIAHHVAHSIRLRLLLDRTADRLRIELDDPIGRRLTRPLLVAPPGDAAAAAQVLSRFDGREALPELDVAAGRGLIDVLVRLSRVALVLADTLASAEIAPLVLSGERWLVAGTRLVVRGVDMSQSTDS